MGHVLPVVSNPEANALMHVRAHTGVTPTHHSRTNKEPSRFVQKGKVICTLLVGLELDVPNIKVSANNLSFAVSKFPNQVLN